MRKGFTFIEVFIAVLFIVLIVALGMRNYSVAREALAERARVAEARHALNVLQVACKAIYETSDDTAGCTQENLKMCACCSIPSRCCAKYYFAYSIEHVNAHRVVFKAKRCIVGGREPQGNAPHSIRLAVDYKTGTSDISQTYDNSK